MKKYNTIYYLLFILLIMGAFASMAQNSYGLKVMGGVAFAFSLLFLLQIINVWMKKGNKQWLALAELTGLFILSAILGLRVFYIHFPYVEVLFAAAGVLLAVVYAVKMILRFRVLQGKNKWLARLTVVFHLSIILFLLSLVMVPFLPETTQPAGMAAFLLLLFLLIAGYLWKDQLVDGEMLSVFSLVKRYRDHSVVIITIFLLFSLFTVFNRAGIIPAIYSDQYPQVYYKLVNEATTRKEKPVDGKYRYELFMEKYSRFLKNK